jgi:hypothetical protein
VLQSEFEKLPFNDKLQAIDRLGVQIDMIIPWTGNLRVSGLYSISNFFVEVVIDYKTREYESIESFKNMDFLEKYPHYTDKIDRIIKGEF